jgi:hypothetical protein
MRYVLMVFMFCLSALVSAQNTQSPDQIRAQMAEIRRTTNWDDPAAAKKANEQIRDLAKQLMSGVNMQGGPGTPGGSGAGSGSVTGNQPGQDPSDDAEDLAEISQDMAQQKIDIFSQIWEAAAGGEGADILLAEPLREEIVEEYRQDDAIEPISWVTEEMEVLVIDVSMRGIQAIIDIMPVYKSIRTLVITNSQNPVPVDLTEILKNAADYPLDELYIVNLGIYVTKLPQEVSQFKNLNTLGIFNNSLTILPEVIENLPGLKMLYADNNPLKSAFPVLNTLKNLKELGLVNTYVQESEITLIENMYPACKVITR